MDWIENFSDGSNTFHITGAILGSPKVFLTEAQEGHGPFLFSPFCFSDFIIDFSVFISTVYVFVLDF